MPGIHPMRDALAGFTRVCSILLAVAFARAGIDKLSSHGGFEGMFASWGHPPGFGAP